MSDTTYNGWTNYETWCVYLWLSNDQGTDSMCEELAQDTVDNLPAHEPGDVGVSEKEYAHIQTGEQIESYVSDLRDDLFHSPQKSQGQYGVFLDLVNAALSEVNWMEIGAAYEETVVYPDPEVGIR